MRGALGGMASIETTLAVEDLPLPAQRAAVLNAVQIATEQGCTPGQALVLLDMLGLVEVAQGMRT